MATKLGRKQFPSGYKVSDFIYQGRPANNQGDFDDSVGLADMVCVNQFGESNKAKHYHGGVLKTNDSIWWVYLEWGRMSPGKSWSPNFRGQDYQFVRCESEQDARKFFKKQLTSKNLKRLEEKKIGGKIVWAGKSGKDGYIVQKLATRERGLPDAYNIKDNSGIKVVVSSDVKKKKDPAKKLSKVFQPQVISLAESLVGGVKAYARAQSAATGVTPTMEAIEEIRNDLLPLALAQLKRVGNNERKQFRDSKLIDISNLVASMVPRPISIGGTQEERSRSVLLSSGNILSIQQDLDTFEQALLNEDWSAEQIGQNQIDPDVVMNAKISWVNPDTEHGKWLTNTFQGMTNNKHHYISRGKAKILNMFAVYRPDRDQGFLDEVKRIAKSRKSYNYKYRAGLQPRHRNDIGDIVEYAERANVFLGIHGTRSVNVQPIISSNLRLPKSLSGVKITGAAFGHGIYFATDWKKSYGYTGHGRAYYGGGGQVHGRGFFMLLTDVICGKPYMTTKTGSWGSAPDGCDSVFAHPSHMRSLQNDEHIIFNQAHQRIRYIIEGTV